MVGFQDLVYFNNNAEHNLLIDKQIEYENRITKLENQIIEIKQKLITLNQTENNFVPDDIDCL